MAEETTTETVEGQAPESDKDKNVQALRQKSDAQEAELVELRPLKHRETIREAGFDPESGEGKSLMRDLESGLVKAEDGKDLHETLVSYAENEYSWKPPVQVTPTEQAQLDSTQRQTQVQGVTSPVEPEDLNAQIAAADEAGNVQLGIVLRNRLQEQQARQRG